mgnify:CR=1 FL=1
MPNNYKHRIADDVLHWFRKKTIKPLCRLQALWALVSWFGCASWYASIPAARPPQSTLRRELQPSSDINLKNIL